MRLYKKELIADWPMRAMKVLKRTMPARGRATESYNEGAALFSTLIDHPQRTCTQTEAYHDHALSPRRPLTNSLHRVLTLPRGLRDKLVAICRDI